MVPNTVSIITITQLSRSACLQNLFTMIQLQTYENIIEWVIVEGSQTDSDGFKNACNITELSKKCALEYPRLNIVYIKYTGDVLSDLRNKGNMTCKGDIIVCMDDDDYYPKRRVEDAVYKLNNSECLIAGCSDIYVYDFYLNTLYKSLKIHNNHSTNNCMAFKREYLLKNSHDSGLKKAEETSFTRGFTENMVQLNSKDCIVVSSHGMNTHDKRQLCIDASNKEKNCLLKISNTPINKLIPIEIFNRMKNNYPCVWLKVT